MDTQEKINTLIETINGINQVTINKWEGKGKIITTDEVDDYENFETTELKETYYAQLGKLYYQENK